ncbi:putative prefoldin subunit [Elsinoe australis]|uniref:Putative prefoldin subunit n=1 Tax=Elsinoe australis TaxID=40998 RepID=A0A4U7B1K6_9PEZI|nr:putative prefoldin subunit [Elsinoe australis]
MATPLCRRTDLCVDMDEQTSKPSSKTGSYYKLKNSVTAALQRRIQILPVNMTCDSEEQMEVGNEDIGGETTRVVIGAESFVTLSSDRPELFSPMPQIGHAFFYTLQTVSKMAALAPRRMLSKQEESEEVEVRKEDQEKINRFSTLHRKVGVIEEELKKKQKEKEDIEEISNELELADEDEKISYKVGDSFMLLPLEKVQELLSQAVQDVETEVTVLEEKSDQLREEMTGLKAALYGRFGKSINLEA